MHRGQDDPPASAAPAEPVRAAGAVLWRSGLGGRQAEIAVIHRPHRRDWSLPKGKLDPGESWPEAALREVLEETGIGGRLGRGLGTVCYVDERFDPPRPKVVRYWAVEALEGWFEPRAEVDELRWLQPEHALGLLTYERDRDVVERFSAAPARTGTVLLIRHAEAAPASGWSGDDGSRALTGAGAARAAALARTLAGFEVAAIFASPAARCMATVQPLAAAAGLAVIADDALSEVGYADDADAAAGRVRGLAAAGSAVAMCTHAPVILDLIGRLGAPRPPGATLPVGSVWALSFHKDDMVAAEPLDVPER